MVRNTTNPAAETCQKYCTVRVDSWVLFHDDAQWADAWRSDPLPECAWHLRSTIYHYFHHHLLVYDKLAHTNLRVISKPMKWDVVAFFWRVSLVSQPQFATLCQTCLASSDLSTSALAGGEFPCPLLLPLSSMLKVGSGEEVLPRTHLDEWYYLTAWNSDK
jgi:hypothetical protein